MKKILLSALISLFALTSHALTINSVASGNATDLLIWDCQCLPADGDTVIINHAVILDIDYSYTMGGIEVRQGGSVTGDVSNRIFGVSGGYFLNEGTVNIGYLFHNGGSFVNQGAITVLGSLLVDQSVTFINDNSVIVGDSMLVNTFASFQNNFGYLSADMFLSAGTITNIGTGFIVCTTLYNSGTLTDNGSGIHVLGSLYNIGNMTLNGYEDIDGDVWNAENITVGHFMIAQSLYSGDSTSGTATFTNNGTVSLSNSLWNSEALNGTGDFCVSDSTLNSGAVTGTLDICDQTGGGWDINTGTEAGTVTHCANGPCTIGIHDDQMVTENLVATPNPATNEISIQLPASDEGIVMVIDVAGRVVMNVSAIGSTITLDIEQLSAGAYTIVFNGSQFRRSGMFIKE